MDLEHLTKHQIVLLTLLVSFVTSIATGIVTVSLVNQAPASVTRTINQIVEHTVEKVVPATESTATVATAAGETKTIERTVVVKDDDLAAQSIAKMQQSLVRIVARGSTLLVSRAVVVAASGVAIADREALAASGARQFEALLPDGKRYPATLRQTPRDQAVAVLDIALGTSTVAAAPLADMTKVQLGASVIRIGGTGSDTVGMGVVASLEAAHPGLIETSVSSATPGSVLMTLFGEVIGLSTGVSRQTGAQFYSVPTHTLFTSP